MAKIVPGEMARMPPESTRAVAENGLNRRYLHVQDLRRLSRMAFIPRQRVEGTFSGKHATPLRGQSIEFRDYRQYMPGDDVGSIDWKVFGRSDRLFIRLFEHQSELAVHLLIDASASMGYYGLSTRAATTRQHRRRRNPVVRTEDSKYDQACRLAAAIAFVMSRQHDRFSINIAQRGLKFASGAGNSIPHLTHSLLKMEETLPFSVSMLPAAVHSLMATARRRDILMIFSDLFDDPPALRKALAAWRHRGGEVVLFQVLHAHELKLPDLETGMFVDSETGQMARVNLNDVRQDYESRIAEFLQEWKKSCAAQGMDHRLASTDEPTHEVLKQYLIQRASMTR